MGIQPYLTGSKYFEQNDLLPKQWPETTIIAPPKLEGKK